MSAVARIALFLGLGVNSANNPALKEYQLSGITQLQFMPDNVNENILADYKNQFSRWIVGNGFRGLIETFSVFIDEVYRACLFASSSLTTMNDIDAKKIEKKFNNFCYRYGLEKKLSQLRDEFDVGIDKPEYFSSISQARNCLTHRLGIVGKEDCGNDDKLIVKWGGIEFYVENPDGKVTPIHPMPGKSVRVEAGGKIKMNWLIERTHIFTKGSLVIFSPAELAEICFYVDRSVAVIVESAQKYVVDLGIPVVASTKDEPKAD